MGEYEDLCQQMGLDPSTDEDYDRLSDALVNGRSIGAQSDPDDEDEPEEILFPTFREASEWSKQHGGKPFTRTADGNYFAPVGSDAAKPLEVATADKGRVQEDPPRVSKAEVRAFFEGKVAPGADWLPGTWPRGASSDPSHANFERDQLKEKRLFLPRLAALAPDIARAKRRGRFSTVFMYTLMSTTFHQAQSMEQLRQLLYLLEGKLIRAKRWYSTQAADQGEDKSYERIPSPLLSRSKLFEHQRQHGVVPEELLFWQGTVEIVRTEIARRRGAVTDLS